MCWCGLSCSRTGCSPAPSAVVGGAIAGVAVDLRRCRRPDGKAGESQEHENGRVRLSTACAGCDLWLAASATTQQGHQPLTKGVPADKHRCRVCSTTTVIQKKWVCTSRFWPPHTRPHPVRTGYPHTPTPGDATTLKRIHTVCMTRRPAMATRATHTPAARVSFVTRVRVLAQEIMLRE